MLPTRETSAPTPLDVPAAAGLPGPGSELRIHTLLPVGTAVAPKGPGGTTEGRRGVLPAGLLVLWSLLGA